MTLAAGRWPVYAEPAAGERRSSALVVYRLELVKISRLIQVRTMLVLGIIGPFLAVAVLRVQSATPGDTAFGQWVHDSGLAIPMVILGFGAAWVGPVLVAVVAGDIFSSEDRFGTWKTILTRSHTRGQLFAGKFLAALTFAVALMVLLTVTDLVAGLVAGTQPVVGLGGQLVPAGHAIGLVVLSYVSDLPPLLGFTALALMLSVISRNSVVGIGGPIVITLVLQVVTLISLPAWAQMALISTPFQAWHGFWAQPAFYGDFLWGLVTSAVWFVICGVVSWLVFRRRTIGVAS
ncbi:MAG TPA: ABC transporter permease [Streptosporangiaceae bacterium]|nr:ABC transporter permease [Streptosporangiaceae bacterium]